MRIAIDISSVVYGTGVSVYTKNLVRALAKIDRQNEYVLFAGTLRQRKAVEEFFQQSNLGENFQLKIFPLSPKMQMVLWNDWHILSLEKLLGPIDVYHSPDWSLAPTKAKTVLTIHDLFFLKRPDLQQYPYKETMIKRLKRAKEKKLQVVAVSKSTKDDLIELLHYPEELSTVIYEAVDDKFKVQGSKFKVKEVKQKYGIEGNYLLMVGTREPRKNLASVLKVFSDLQNSKLPRRGPLGKTNLVIAGKVGWGESLVKTDNVQLIGYVPDEDLPRLYCGSSGFLYPSLYEGFGISILEAFACGIPVLTSRISSMPEVAGKAAIYVDPYSTDSIREGIQKMLNLKPADRNRLIKRGFEQLKKFSWEKTARETLNIYEQD